VSIASIDVIVGGQFGSEAKGHVTKRVLEVGLEDPYRMVNVRVAGPNAGHCVLNNMGQKFALRSIPVGAVYDRVDLLIAPGSEIEPAVLWDEFDTLTSAGHSLTGRLFVHEEATILTPEHQWREQGMQERMGSTGKGIGACRADRIMRRAERVKDNLIFTDMCRERGIAVINDDQMYRVLYAGSAVVIEGTQGYGLGLHAGYYPQCTSSDTRAVDFLAMAGLDSTFARVYTPWVVARVHPIRVAGNSGPLRGETSWEELGLPTELTTVTKKVRRVGEWDRDLVNNAIRANGPQSIVALTMFDQRVPSIAGANAQPDSMYPSEWTDDARRILNEYKADVNAPIRLVTTGEDTAVWL
jgi:adenylosuccinate synthase